MNKKVLIALAVAVIFGGMLIMNNMKKNEHVESSVKQVSQSDIPVKIEQLDIQPTVAKNKNGEVLLYLKAANNSKTPILSIAENVKDSKGLDVYIEYLHKLNLGEKTDNYDDIKNSKDDRTKYPIKGKDGKPLKKVSELKITKYSYAYVDNGKKKVVKYYPDKNKYTVEDF